MLDPDAYLFTTPGGTPIDESNFYKREWLPMLQKVKIRPRDFYNTRHSYASFMLSIGARMNFISAQTGDSEETLRKHYAKYIESIDPQRDWIETQIRKSEKFSKKGEKSSFARSESKPQKMKKPRYFEGLRVERVRRVELPTLCLASIRSSQLSYTRVEFLLQQGCRFVNYSRLQRDPNARISNEKIAGGSWRRTRLRQLPKRRGSTFPGRKNRSPNSDNE